MHTLSLLYLVVATSLPSTATQQNMPPISQDLLEPLAAVSRIATGLQAENVCNRLPAEAKTTMRNQLAQAVQTLHQRLLQGGLPAPKSQRILVKLMDEGEKLAKHNYPTCTNTAPDIIVKASNDAACINQYLAGTNTACFR